MKTAYSKYLKVIGGAITAVALLCVTVAFSLPDEITREKNLVSYQQQGDFSYQVFLKPSALYDGPSAEAAVFPAEVISTVDFNFSFTPSGTSGSSVSMSAILSNPGIWQKRISLGSTSVANGTLALPVSITLDDVETMFTDIETELLLTGNFARMLTIEASVAAGSETFTHRIELELTETVVRVANNLRQGQLAGQSGFTYAVALKPNNVFDTATLSPPAGNAATIAPAGAPILMRLADEMVLDYAYLFTADQTVTGVTSDVEIKATLSAPELWTKEYLLFRGQRGAGYDLRLALDLAAFDNLIETVRTETGVSADSYTLDVSATTRLRGASAFGPVDETFTQVMKGTISRNVLTWDEEHSVTADGAITQEETAPNDKTYLGLTLGSMRTWSLALAIIGGTVLFSGFMLRSPSARERPAEAAEKELASITKKYGARMVTAGGSPGDDAAALALDSIEGLVSVADELGKPIVYFPPHVAWMGHTFCVFDGKIRYQFTLETSRESAG